MKNETKSDKLCLKNIFEITSTIPSLQLLYQKNYLSSETNDLKVIPKYN